MPRSTGRPDQPRGTRDDLLNAWLNRNKAQVAALGGKGHGFVRNRLRTLVGDTAGLFPDIEPSVQVGGRGGKVGWELEPYASDGTGTKQFNLVLERLGLVALALVRTSLAELEGSELFAELVAAGIPVGGVKPQIGWQIVRHGGGERLMGIFGKELADSLDQLDPDPIGMSVTRAVALVADAHLVQRARREFVARASADLQMFNSLTEVDGDPAPRDAASSDELAAILSDAVSLCALVCGADRKRTPLTPYSFEKALLGTVERWTGRGRRDVDGGLTRPMKVRLAHTKIDPDFFKSVGGGRNSEALTQRLVRAHSNSAFEIDFEQGLTPFVLMYQWFLDQGYREFKGQARRSGLPAQDLEDLLHDNWEDARNRLLKEFADSYVDPDRAPEDWDRFLRNVVTLRGVAELLAAKRADGIEYGRPDEDADEEEVNPFDRQGALQVWGPVQVNRDFDSVETEYWCTRDADMLNTEEFHNFLRSCPYVRQPYLSIAQISFLATMLTSRAADEVGFDALRAPSGGVSGTTWYAFDEGDSATVGQHRKVREQALAELRYLLDKHLESLLLSGYRQVPQTTIANRLRAQRGQLFSGIDIPAAFMSWKPSGRDRAEWAELALVAQTAVHRAVYLVLGRAAMAADPDQGSDGDPGSDND